MTDEELKQVQTDLRREMKERDDLITSLARVRRARNTLSVLQRNVNED